MTPSFKPRFIFAISLLAMIGSVRVPSLAAQNNTPQLSSNLEETAGTTSKGKVTLGDVAGPVALPDDFSKLQLEPSDALALDVFDVPLLSVELTIDDAGDIHIPLAGPIHVQGDTPREAEKKISDLLVERQLVKSPSVSLRILAFARQAVTVSGEVQTPGRVQLLAPRTLIDVLALAGGETPAAGGNVEIRHPDGHGGTTLVTIPYAAGKDSEAARLAKVYPGDDVYVRRAGVVYVLGAVQRPGGYLMVSGGTLTVPQAISLALGTTLVAVSKDAVIVRKQDGQLIRTTVALKDQEVGKEQPIFLKDGDMLYIPTSKVKAVLINSQSVLSAAASAGIIGGLQR